MSGIKALRKLQIGKEVTPGTGVAATAILRFEGLWKDDREIEFPLENVGYISGRDRNYTALLKATMAMEGPATFEQLPYILEAAVKAVTPTTDTGSGYIYTYTFPTTALPTITTYTIEAGDNQAMEEASYSHVADFTLSGAAKEAWKVAANWVARQIVDSDSFTPSTDITVTEVEEMLFQKSKLYIDNDTDTIGTTQKSNTFLAAELKVTTGSIPKWTGDGNLYFSFVQNVGPEVMLDVTFEHDGTATAEKTNWRNRTARLIRIKCEGNTLTSAGTYTVKTMIIDLAGKWETFDVIGDIDGNDICKGTFRARYNTNSTKFAEIIIVNELTTLP